MSKILLFGAIISIFATNVFAVSSTVTSKDYVDDLVATKQVKIPAAGATGVGAGETIITYTGAAGTIGERGIYSDASSYNATTDADKIITASALNGAVSNISTTETSKLTCYDTNCTLWNIGTQTAYGADPTMKMLNSLVNTNGTGRCYKRLSDGTVNAETCINQPVNYGDWGTTFTYNGETVQVSGISACSIISGTANQPASNQTQVRNEYGKNLAKAPTTSPIGGKCYCKMTDPSVSGARWVFRTVTSESYCASYCAAYCGNGVRDDAAFRAAVFGLTE